MTALLTASNDIDVLDDFDILELRYLSEPDVRIIDVRDIVVTPYLTLNMARVQKPNGAAGSQIARVPLLGLWGRYFALGGFDVLKAALEGTTNSFVQCDVYRPGEIIHDCPDIPNALMEIQSGFHGQEDELWSYVKVVDRRDWDIAETYRQPLRLVQTMRKALDVLEAEGVTPHDSWEEALQSIAECSPARWDDDFAYCSENHYAGPAEPEECILLMSRRTAEALQ